MGRKPSTVFLPEMALTLVRRVTAKLPYNHFLFRVDPKHTKAEIREYLTKVYSVDVARITTSVSLGALPPQCGPPRRAAWTCSSGLTRRGVPPRAPPCCAPQARRAACRAAARCFTS